MEKNTPLLTALLRYLLLTAIASALTLVLSRVLHVNYTTEALALLVLVLVTAYKWRFAYSIYLALLCTVLYNLFFLPPVGRLTIQDGQNWVALFAFLCTSVLVSHLSDRERRLAEASEVRRREVELLFRLSQKLLVQDEVKELARSTPAVIASIFGYRAVALHVASTDTVCYSDPDRIFISSAELKQANAESASAAELVKSGIVVVPLRLGSQLEIGRLAILDQSPSTPIYEAVGGLVSVALERAATLERNSRLESARESERLRSALVDSITHDLRTPLTAIRAAATTLLSEKHIQDAERDDLTAVVAEESERLDRLIGQAVEMARLDSQNVHVDLEPQDFAGLVEMTVERMQHVLHAQRIEIDIDPAMPLVRMDRRLMQRVLQHLLENAARYSPPDQPINISAAVRENRLLVTVGDRGAGIDPDDLPLIFDKYFRGKRQSGKARGTGMGLAIARAILKAHSGGISVESKPGEGTRFTFWIPIAP